MKNGCTRGRTALFMLLTTTLLAVSGTISGAVAEGLTIDEAIRIALQNNIALQAQRQTIAVAEGELRSARTFRNNPRLELAGAAGTESNEAREDVRNFSAKFSQEFELGGQRRWRTRAAMAALEQTRWEVQDAQRELVKEVKETFYRLVFLEEKLAFADQAMDLAQQLLRIAEERYRAGDRPQLDVNLALVELQNVVRQRDEARRQWRQARFTLNRLLGRPVDAELVVSSTLDAPPLTLDHGQWRQQALQQRPDLQGRSATVEAAMGELGLAKAERVPDLEVGFVFERQVTGERVERTFGGSIAFALPLWNRRRGEIEAAQARMRAAELRRTALQQSVETEVATALAEVEQLRTAVQLYQETILPQSRENLTLLRQVFAAGEVGIVPLVTEQRAFIAINNEYLETWLAYHVALATLESAAGVSLAHQR